MLSEQIQIFNMNIFHCKTVDRSNPWNHMNLHSNLWYYTDHLVVWVYSSLYCKWKCAVQVNRNDTNRRNRRTIPESCHGSIHKSTGGNVSPCRRTQTTAVAQWIIVFQTETDIVHSHVILLFCVCGVNIIFTSTTLRGPVESWLEKRGDGHCLPQRNVFLHTYFSISLCAIMSARGER